MQPQHPLLHKLILVLVLVIFLVLVSGQREDKLEVNETEVHQSRMQDKKKQQHRLSLRHPFDGFFSSKRKIPNASDPLHNR
ncbi:hypothetical protein M5689_016761 [Euphorbia peplus]|nr:hypothetical protein M5689_016761 [Euphorbia peplus]